MAGFQEVNAGNGITEEDVADMPALENLAERRRRRQRIRDADASARSTLRELFLSSWGGQPIEGTVTLPELYEYANEWLLPAPPLIESEAATAIAQLSPNMASVPAELLHCLCVPQRINAIPPSFGAFVLIDCCVRMAGNVSRSTSVRTRPRCSRKRSWISSDRWPSGPRGFTAGAARPPCHSSTL